MKILRGLSTNPAQPATDPFPAKAGIFFELRGGDVCDPYLDPDGWFGPKKPLFVLRWFAALALLPFLSWRVGNVGGYIGFKCYGVDSPAYAGQLCAPEEVFAGSQALCFTARLYADLSDGK